MSTQFINVIESNPADFECTDIFKAGRYENCCSSGDKALSKNRGVLGRFSMRNNSCAFNKNYIINQRLNGLMDTYT
ncbi:unnamed protein product [Rhizophagus irregularis]|nr:unnamed protein product [Rhizophagus irregularis]CAB4434883.1 unnamed protein product [Rhizophagus irregularis]